jgi:cytochrome c oxidase subunit 2
VILLAVVLAALVAAIVVLTQVGGLNIIDQQPYSHISPATQKAEDIQFLYRLIFWLALVVFVGVQAAIVYTVLRFRQRSGARPPQIHGNRTAEIAWTVIPAVVLLAVFIPTAQTIFKHAAAEEAADFPIEIYGKQWWWEVHYPGIPLNDADPAAGPLVTANEILIPQGADVVFHLRSNNVIHSFWVPQLSGKRDVIPGHDNKLQFTADKVGEYFGECTEFCGGAHAWMRFKVLVVPQAEFDAWVQAMRQPPAVDGRPETADVIEAPAAFGTCLACHRINGTNAVIARQGLNSDPKSIGAGPNLTMLACRDVIGAGILENTPENLARWLKETDDVKDGVYMPNYYETGQINDQQVQELVDYLGSLEPAGGCPADPPIGGNAEYLSDLETDNPNSPQEQ